MGFPLISVQIIQAELRRFKTQPQILIAQKPRRQQLKQLLNY